MDEDHAYPRQTDSSTLVQSVLGATNALSDILSKGSIKREHFATTMPIKREKSKEPRQMLMQKTSSKGILIEKLDA